MFKIFKKKDRPRKIKVPETEKWWTTLYYGPRGSGKSYHQAKVAQQILKYWDWLYWKFPDLKPAIMMSVQKFSPDLEKEYLRKRLFYWTDARDLRYCPRPDCWRGKTRHRLHGAYILFDDMATILPADHWQNTPVWFRKMFSQARHFGIRILANCQDPFSVDINFRRYVDMAFKFRKGMATRDPDETRPKLKFVFGIYHRRKIRAEWLWKLGDMSEDEIEMFKLKQKQMSEITGSHFFKDVWRASVHFITRRGTEIYDTTQDVPEYRPKGYAHHELRCIDPTHNHNDPKAPNYCGYKKVFHEVV